MSMINPLVYITTWYALDSSRLTMYIPYYLFGLLTGALQSHHEEILADREINHGMLSIRLLQPLSVIQFMFINEMAYRIVRISIAVVLVTSIYIIFIGKFPTITPLHTLQALCSCLLTIGISFGLVSCMGMTAFWLDTEWNSINILDTIAIITAGYVMPLDFFPWGLGNMLVWLPYASLYYIPASILQQRFVLGSVWTYLGIQCVWCVFFLILSMIMLRKGLVRYDAHGA